MDVEAVKPAAASKEEGEESEGADEHSFEEYRSFWELQVRHIYFSFLFFFSFKFSVTQSILSIFSRFFHQMQKYLKLSLLLLPPPPHLLVSLLVSLKCCRT